MKECALDLFFSLERLAAAAASNEKNEWRNRL